MSQNETPQGVTSVERLAEEVSLDVDRLERIKEKQRPENPVGEIGHEGYIKVNIPTARTAPILKHIGQERAPNEGSEWNHIVGTACEFAASLVCGAQINREIYADFEGDDGYDFAVPWGDDKRLVEVKGTTDWRDPTATVSKDELDTADVFILCRTDSPRTRVHVIGMAYRPQVKFLGNHYRDDGYILDPEYLTSLGSGTITKEQVIELVDRIY